MTNFEKIQTMSKEQLAQNLAKMAHDAPWFDTVCRNVCEACGNHTPSGCRYDLEIYDCEYVSDDKALFLRWLELESEINIKSSLGIENAKNHCSNRGAKMDGKEITK